MDHHILKQFTQLGLLPARKSKPEFLQPVPAPVTSQSQILEAAQRRTKGLMLLSPFSSQMQFVQKRGRTRSIKELKLLSKSALPSRAIMLIRNLVSSLEYRIKPKTKDQKRDDAVAGIIESVFDNPNSSCDDLQSFVGPVIEDLMIFDSAGWEYVPAPDFITGNDLLALENFPGETLLINPLWTGDPNVPRYAQGSQVYSTVVGPQQQFLNSEIEHLMMRATNQELFGYSPLEAAAEIMDAWLGLASYQKTTASNLYPAFMFYLGPDINEEDPRIQRFRQYWENEIVGQGRPGVFGGFGDKEPKSIQLKPTTDDGLYLSYQEQLIRVFAFCFNLKPQDFGIERDVNRSQGKVSQEASVREGARPVAMMLARKFNQRVIPTIALAAGNPAILDYKFEWENIDASDEKGSADIRDVYLKNDVYTIDEVRSELGLGPLDGGIGALTLSAYRQYVTIANPALDQPGGTTLDQPPGQQDTSSTNVDLLQVDRTTKQTP